jgi:hypothetical protein
MTASDEKVNPSAINAVLKDKRENKAIPERVAEFFDQHIHDSHASFRLLEPLTQEERDNAVQHVLDKHAQWAHTGGRHGTKTPKLNPLEQHIYDNHQAILQGKAKAGSFPVMSDADLADLRDMNDPMTTYLVRLVTPSRRESGSVLRFRVVFDGKNNQLDTKITEALKKAEVAPQVNKFDLDEFKRQAYESIPHFSMPS